LAAVWRTPIEGVGIMALTARWLPSLSPGVRLLATMERPQTGYVEIDGVEVAYQTVGHGPPDVVYVPGF